MDERENLFLYLLIRLYAPVLFLCYLKSTREMLYVYYFCAIKIRCDLTPNSDSLKAICRREEILNSPCSYDFFLNLNDRL